MSNPVHSILNNIVFIMNGKQSDIKTAIEYAELMASDDRLSKVERKDYTALAKLLTKKLEAR